MARVSGSVRSDFPKVASPAGPKPARAPGWVWTRISCTYCCGTGIPAALTPLHSGVGSKRSEGDPGAGKFSQKKLAFQDELLTLRLMSEVLLSYRGRAIGPAEVEFLRQ